MTTPLRRLLLPLSIVALAVPASASGATVPVAPPSGSSDSFATAAKAAADPGCRSFDVIEFRDPALPPPYAVRHGGNIRCEVPIRSRCHATLFQGNQQVSEIGDRGRNRCRMGSDFSGAYSAGDAFRESYRFRLTLRRDGQRWSGTSQFCPKRENNRRTLICRGSHTTVAPQREVDRHS